jgi:hypothetical protein
MPFKNHYSSYYFNGFENGWRNSWLINNDIPIDRKIKSFLNVVTVIVVTAWSYLGH